MLRKILKNAFGRQVLPSNNRRSEADMFKKTTIKPCRLGPADGAMDEVFGDTTFDNYILKPLYLTKGIQFPYTPDVTFGGQAEYQDFHFTHSNYAYNNFTKSMPSEIQVQATFTAQTNDEGRYLIATLHFLRAMTMMEFGSQAAYKGTAGTPPPVLRFNYLGEYMFSNVPVVITTFSYTLPKDVDYVGIRYPSGTGFNPNMGKVIEKLVGKGMSGPVDLPRLGGEEPVTHVPTRLELMVQLKVQQNPRKVRREFDLESFKKGSLIKKGFI